MADRLARIFGTEEDKVNCPFYFKIGACRHGDTCTRLHNKPVVSQTILMPHLYENPPAAVAFADGIRVPDPLLVEAINHFEGFYEEVFMELAKYGEIEELHVCDNIGEHLLGNVYVKFYEELEAEKAVKGLSGRYYSGKMIKIEYSPVTDFKESRCRLYKEGSCDTNSLSTKNAEISKFIISNFIFNKLLRRKQDLKLLPPQPKKERRPSASSSSSRSRSSSKKKDRKHHNHNHHKYKKHHHYRKKRSHSRSLSIHLRDERSSSRSKRSSSSSNSSRSSSYSRDKKRNKHKKHHYKRKEGGDLRRQTSEERRAIIDAWNNEGDDKVKSVQIIKEHEEEKPEDPRKTKKIKAINDTLKQMIMQLQDPNLWLNNLTS